VSCSCCSYTPVWIYLNSHTASAMEDASQDRLSYALSILAGDPCLQIGPGILSACRDIVFADPESAECSQVTETSLSTWLCDDALFFTLIKSDGQNLVYSHTNKVLYYAVPQAQLSAACPDGCSILCQFTVDKLPQESVPRLLAFDLLLPRGVDPAARGEALRALSVHMPAPLCCVQWVGSRRYLTPQFVSGLPHRASRGFALTTDARIVAGLPSI
jgi:hypothetical protein